MSVTLPDGELSRMAVEAGEQHRRIAELEAEVERLRADGERLDWLIDQHGSGKNLEVMDCMANTAAYLCPLVSSEADDIQKWYRAAIDAARKEQA